MFAGKQNHPMSVAAFSSAFPEQYKFVVEQLACVPKAIVSMPVKSGKRVVVQCEAAIDRGFGSGSNFKHIFATSFKRNDCKEQMTEMELYGIKVFCGKALHTLSKYVRGVLVQGDVPVIHFDESDFGTGYAQIAGKVFNELVELPDNGWEKLKIRAYSATNEEAIYSEFADLCQKLEPIMPSTFRHAPWFLAKGLVEESEEFWCSDSETFSPQALSALEKWKNDDKPFAIVRFAASRGEKNTHYNDVKNSEKFRLQLDSDGILPKFVDNKNPFYWGKDFKRTDGWGVIDRKRKILLVVNQTCIRSTEVGFHPLISFWHDHRTKDTPYSTCAQAMFRVNHYDYRENPEAWANPEVNIKVYGCVSTFRFAAKIIDAEKYRQISGRQLSKRIAGKNRILSRNPEHFDIVDTDNEEEFVEEVRSKFGKNISKFEKDSDGVYRNTFRGETSKWDKKKLESEKFSGLNGDSKFRKYVYYVGDTPRFWAIYHSGIMDDAGASFETKQDSMYNGLRKRI